MRGSRQRFREMLAQGFIAEVEELMRLPEMRADCPAMRAVGYRQLWGMLAGDHDRAEAETSGACGDPAAGQAATDLAAS